MIYPIIFAVIYQVGGTHGGITTTMWRNRILGRGSMGQPASPNSLTGERLQLLAALF